MSRRIEIELTSDRGDGTWTWRAAGARKPRGVVPAGLVPAGAKAGDVLRAEIEVEIEGITVLSLGVGPRARAQGARAHRGRRLPSERRRARDHPAVGDGPQRRDRDRPRPRAMTVRPRRPRQRPRPDGERKRPWRPAATRRPRTDRPAATAPARDRPAPGRPRSRGRPPEGERGRPRRPAPPPLPERPKPKRLRPGRAHRKAVLADLAPEQQPIAEQVLKGGIPAVRQAIEAENDKRKAADQPPINAPELLELAEQLLPRLRTADWRDRADAALADADELDLRDLRSVVVASDAAARDDETRALAADLRAKLEARVEAEHHLWLEDLGLALVDRAASSGRSGCRRGRPRPARSCRRSSAPR